MLLYVLYNSKDNILCHIFISRDELSLLNLFDSSSVAWSRDFVHAFN